MPERLRRVLEVNEPLNPAAQLASDEAYRMGRVRRFFAQHPRAMDLLLALIITVPNVAAPLIASPAFNLEFVVAKIVISVAAAAPMFLRRSYPWPTHIALIALTVISVAWRGDTGGAELAMAFTLYGVITLRGPRAGWIAFAASLLLTSGAVLLFGQDTVTHTAANRQPFIALTLIMIAIMLLVAMAIGASVRNRREQLQLLIDQANLYRLERDQREQLATASERARIAREMHDVVAHSLSVMVALADGAKATIYKAPNHSDAALGELTRTGRAALSDMRRILGVLRTENSDPADMAPQPGTPALEELTARFRAAGMNVRLSHTGPLLPQDASLELTVYRIVQEGLTNVLRHSPGAELIAVTVLRAAGRVTVQVRNSAARRPSDRHAGSGQGLIGMRERTAAYGGTVEAGPENGGWMMRASLFFEETQAAPNKEESTAP